MGNEPLSGTTVVSMAHRYPGPYATLILADLGADVIVVERPGGGDPARQFPKFHEALNRNKRSIALDLSIPRGREAFLRIARQADVVLEGFRPNAVRRLGLDYAAVRAVKSDIVYVSISGFGQSGPLHDRPAHDLSYQAMAGLIDAERGASRPGRVPLLALGDISAGMFALAATLTGLFIREQGGGATYFDVAIADSLISWMTPYLFAEATHTTEFAHPPQDPGYGLFLTADDETISVSIAHEDLFWQRLCRVLSLAEYESLNSAQRKARMHEIRGRVAEAMATRTSQELEEAFEEADVPFSKVLSLREVLRHEHLRSRELLIEVPGNEKRPTRQHIRQPLMVAGKPTEIQRHVPALGEHTKAVLLEAGYSQNEVELLIREGIAHIA